MKRMALAVLPTLNHKNCSSCDCKGCSVTAAQRQTVFFPVSQRQLFTKVQILIITTSRRTRDSVLFCIKSSSVCNPDLLLLCAKIVLANCCYRCISIAQCQVTLSGLKLYQLLSIYDDYKTFRNGISLNRSKKI